MDRNPGVSSLNGVFGCVGKEMGSSGRLASSPSSASPTPLSVPSASTCIEDVVTPVAGSRRECRRCTSSARSATIAGGEEAGGEEAGGTTADTASPVPVRACRRLSKRESSLFAATWSPSRKCSSTHLVFRWQCRERVRLCVVDPHLHAVSSFRLRPDMLSAWLSHLLVTSKAEAYHSVVQAVCPVSTQWQSVMPEHVT